MRLAASLCLSLMVIATRAIAAEALQGMPSATDPASRPGEPRESAESPPKAVADPKFDVLEFDVVGNTVLQTIEIERAVYPYLGPGRTLSDVEAARNSLQDEFQAKGYLTVSVDIPEQKVEDGVVRLRVLEGRVERVRVTGSRYYSLGYIKERAATLAENTVPYFPEVQHELAALNRTPDRRVTPQLRPGRTPGTVAVDLNVEDKLPAHGDVELNNRRSPNTSELRLSGSLRYDNLWQSDHSLSIQYQVAPQHSPDAKVWSATYLAPLEDDRSLALYAVRSRSAVAAVGTLDVLGNGDIAGLRYIVPLPGDSALYHSITLGVDHKRFGEAVLLQGGDALRTPITYTPFSAQYGGTEIDGSGSAQFSLTANFDVRRILGNSDAAFGNKRYGATANFFYLRGDLARTERLPADWSTYLRLSGQSSAAPLISNEGFTVGGVDTVRGYLEAEQIGDNGLQGTFEVRTPRLFPNATDGFREFYLLAFADAASVKLKQPLPGQRANFSLASRGVGLRLTSRKDLRLGIDVAQAFRETQYTHEGETRAQFHIGIGF